MQKYFKRIIYKIKKIKEIWDKSPISFVIVVTYLC